MADLKDASPKLTHTELVVASDEWQKKDEAELTRLLGYTKEQGGKDRYGKYGHLPVRVISKREFMCPLASRRPMPYRLVLAEKWRLVNGYNIFVDNFYTADISDEVIWQQSLQWIKTWCTAGREGFSRDKHYKLQPDELPRVDAIYFSHHEMRLIMTDTKFPLGVDEAVEALAGRPKTMRNWFLTPAVIRLRDWLKAGHLVQETRQRPTLFMSEVHDPYASYDVEVWRSVPVAADEEFVKASKMQRDDLVHLQLFVFDAGQTDLEAPGVVKARASGAGKIPGLTEAEQKQYASLKEMEAMAMAKVSSATTRLEKEMAVFEQWGIQRWLEVWEKKKGKPMNKEEAWRIAVRKEQQQDVQFLEDVLAGRGAKLDTQNLFRILNASGGIPSQWDPEFWHYEAQRTWEMHADQKYEVGRRSDEGRKLSWAARMQLRLFPERCLARYVLRHFPEGVGRLLETGGSEERLVELHPRFQQARAKQAAEVYPPEIADLISTFGKVRVNRPRVRLFREK